MADEDGLIREVNEAMRMEKAQQWWARFGRQVVAASAAIVIATAAFVVWKDERHAAQSAATLALIEAMQYMQERDYATAAEALQTQTETAPKALADLGRYWQAQLQLRHTPEAIEGDIFAVIADTAPESLAMLARLQALYAGENIAVSPAGQAAFGPAYSQLVLAEQVMADAPQRVSVRLPDQTPLSLRNRVQMLDDALASRLPHTAESE